MYIKRRKSTVADFKYNGDYFKIMYDRDNERYIYLRYQYIKQITTGRPAGYWQKLIEDSYTSYEQASERMSRQIYTLVHDSYM